MADRPILFSAPMVRALLNGTKTQTRRILKPQPSDFQGAKLPPAGKSWVNKKRDAPFFAMHHDLEHWCWWDEYLDQGPDWIKVRFAKGDRLWIRETWNWTFIKDLAPGEMLGRTLDECCDANGGFACPVGDGIVYAATNAHEHPEFGKARWKPAIHMSRYASRLTLEVTDVRVERLQDISEADALAEGIDRIHYPDFGDWGWPQRAYAKLWESINGPGSWDANPFVVAVSFTVHRGNIDQMGRAS